MGLPPEAARIWNVPKDGRIETPCDPLGRVDLDHLIQLGKAAICPDYDWQAPFNDVHHLQYPARWYRTNGVFRDFRELTTRKVYIPRTFHDWLHYVMTLPLIPSREVMHESAQAERITIGLASVALRALQLAESNAAPRRIEVLFDMYSHYVEALAAVPQEFRLVTPDQIAAGNVEQMIQRNALLGKLALHIIPNRVSAIYEKPAS